MSDDIVKSDKREIAGQLAEVVFSPSHRSQHSADSKEKPRLYPWLQDAVEDLRQGVRDAVQFAAGDTVPLQEVLEVLEEHLIDIIDDIEGFLRKHEIRA